MGQGNKIAFCSPPLALPVSCRHSFVYSCLKFEKVEGTAAVALPFAFLFLLVLINLSLGSPHL